MTVPSVVLDMNFQSSSQQQRQQSQQHANNTRASSSTTTITDNNNTDFEQCWQATLTPQQPLTRQQANNMNSPVNDKAPTFLLNYRQNNNLKQPAANIVQTIDTNSNIGSSIITNSNYEYGNTRSDTNYYYFNSSNSSKNNRSYSNTRKLAEMITRSIVMRRIRLLKILLLLLSVSLFIFYFCKSPNTSRIDINETFLKLKAKNQLTTHTDNGDWIESEPIKQTSDIDIESSNNFNLHSERNKPTQHNERINHQGNKYYRQESSNKHIFHESPSTKPSHVGYFDNQDKLLLKPKQFTDSIYLTQKDFSNFHQFNEMQLKIREAAKFSWDNYKRYAWGQDMLKPRSRQSEAWFGLGLTIVDSVDTLIVMGLIDETNQALEWIENSLTMDSPNENSNCFELTIRILGGLLSAYHLTSREKIKSQAIDLGDRLLHCYDTSIKVIPYSDINLFTRQAHPPSWNQHSSLSEAASLQLEFRYLTHITGDKRFEETTFKTSEHIHDELQKREHKLLPMYIDTSSGKFEDTIITLGARTDSYYEYLLKQYLQTGIKWLEDDYLDAIDETQKRLIQFTNGSRNYTFVSELQIYKTANGTEELKYVNKMDHLVCFLPGTLALGYYHFSPLASSLRARHNLTTSEKLLNARYNNHLRLAKSIARTCYHMYSEMGTGLAPEIVTFIQQQTAATSSDSSQAGVSGSSEESQLKSDVNLSETSETSELLVQSTSAYNILRPEYVETLFYLYHITGASEYRDQAKLIFESFHKYSRVATGFSPIADVRIKPPDGVDLNQWLYQRAPERMESFWISETLKYLFLVFCDDSEIVSKLLNNHVFNTEAHLLPLPTWKIVDG